MSAAKTCHFEMSAAIEKSPGSNLWDISSRQRTSEFDMTVFKPTGSAIGIPYEERTVFF